MAAGQGLPGAHPGRSGSTFADDLHGQHETLDKRVQTLEYTVDQIGNGSKGLLDEVATGKITGEEDIWSHTDLYDFQANVDGARVGYEGLKPLLEVKDPALSKEIAERFDALQTLLDKYRVGRGRLRLLRQGQRAGAQGAVRRGQRAVRAAVQDDRSHHAVTEPQHLGPCLRRRLLGVAGAGALAVGARCRRIRGREGRGRLAGRSRRRDLPLQRRAPGRHPHPDPGPAALRCLRRHHRLPRRAGRPAEGLDRAAAEMTAGTTVGGGAPLPYDSPPADTGEALGLPPPD